MKIGQILRIARNMRTIHDKIDSLIRWLRSKLTTDDRLELDERFAEIKALLK